MAVIEPEPSASGDRGLAEVLASALAADPATGPGWAEQAGLWWAEDQVPTERELSWEDGTRQVGALFDRLGFAPRLVDGATHRHLELRGCPFRDVARTHPQIVCNLHLGLLRGALGRLQAEPSDQAGLRPFVEPALCVVDLPKPVQRAG